MVRMLVVKIELWPGGPLIVPARLGGWGLRTSRTWRKSPTTSPFCKTTLGTRVRCSSRVIAAMRGSGGCSLAQLTPAPLPRCEARSHLSGSNMRSRSAIAFGRLARAGVLRPSRENRGRAERLPSPTTNAIAAIDAFASPERARGDARAWGPHRPFENNDSYATSRRGSIHDGLRDVLGVTTGAVRAKAVERDGRLLVVRDVPVHVSEGCGEVYLNGETARQFDVLFREMLESPADHAVRRFVPAA